MTIDLEYTDLRLSSLRAVHDSKPYQVQKSKVQEELESFLFPLPSPQSIYFAVPQDINRFLEWKERKGKAKVHVPSCAFLISCYVCVPF